MAIRGQYTVLMCSGATRLFSAVSGGFFLQLGAKVAAGEMQSQ